MQENRIGSFLIFKQLAAEVAQKIGSQNVELHIVPDAPHGPSGFMNETVFAQKEQFLQRNLH